MYFMRKNETIEICIHKFVSSNMSNQRSAFGWSCTYCTFYHHFHNDYCSMCFAIREYTGLTASPSEVKSGKRKSSTTETDNSRNSPSNGPLTNYFIQNQTTAVEVAATTNVPVEEAENVRRSLASVKVEAIHQSDDLDEAQV